MKVKDLLIHVLSIFRNVCEHSLTKWKKKRDNFQGNGMQIQLQKFVLTEEDFAGDLPDPDRLENLPPGVMHPELPPDPLLRVRDIRPGW